MKLQSEICVVGNGAIGKAAALALALAGFDVVLLQPASPLTRHSVPDGSWDLRVYALNHIARTLLSSLKVWEAMDAARIAPVEAMHICGDAPDHPGRLAFDAYGARVDGLAWIVEDQNLNGALDAALQFAPGLRVVTATALHMQVTTERATILLDSGAQLDSALVVGADGAQSWVRGQADIGLDYRSYNQRAVVTNFSCEKPHHGVASQWFLGADGVVALLPLPENRVSLVWSAPDALAEVLMAEPVDKLCLRLGALPGQTLGHLAPLSPPSCQAYPLRLMRAHASVAHRVVLLGDAAHVVHPLAGQGMNLGFADVLAILAVLARRENKADCGDMGTLGRYARARKEDIMLMQIATDGLQRLFASELAPVRALRNAGLGLVNQLPFLKRRLIAHALGKSSSLF